MKKTNPSDYSPPNVNYWGDRCCKAEAEIERLRAALKDMLAFFGKPRRDEWMNEAAWKEACQVCANAEAALTAAAEVGCPDDDTISPSGRIIPRTVAKAAINYPDREVLRQLLTTERNATIERCAQVMDKRAAVWLRVMRWELQKECEDAAAEIRALKDS